MDAGKRARMIEQYEQGYAAVEEALACASESELDARPAPEEWTAPEIVPHLADSEIPSPIADPFHAFGHALQRECLRFYASELVPVDRRRNRRAGKRGHRVRGYNVFPVLIPVHIEEEPPLTLLLAELGRQLLGRAGSENLADGGGRLVYLLEGLTPLERHRHVQPFASTGLYVHRQIELF